MDEASNRVDRAVGRAVCDLKDMRAADLERAAAASGLADGDLDLIIAGSRRLCASEMYLLSRELSIHIESFFSHLSSIPSD